MSEVRNHKCVNIFRVLRDVMELGAGTGPLKITRLRYHSHYVLGKIVCEMGCVRSVEGNGGFQCSFSFLR